jgi:predicted RecA/RadA family phage recombinase
MVLVALAGPIFAAGNTGIVKKVRSGDLVQFDDTFVARLTGIKAADRGEALGPEVHEITKRQREGTA